MLFEVKFKLSGMGGGWLGGRNKWKYSHLSPHLGFGLGAELGNYKSFVFLHHVNEGNMHNTSPYNRNYQNFLKILLKKF